MKRRSFLASTAFTPLMLAAGRAFADSWQQGFNASIAEHPWLLGYRSVVAPAFASDARTLEGQIPQALRGTL